MQIKMNSTSQITARLGLQANGKIQKSFTKKCKDSMDKFVPMSAGVLRKQVQIDGDEIVYQTPYAHYMYKGVLYVDSVTGSSYSPLGGVKIPAKKDVKLIYHTPGTGSYWDKKMWSANGKQIIKELESEIKRG